MELPARTSFGSVSCRYCPVKPANYKDNFHRPLRLRAPFRLNFLFTCKAFNSAPGFAYRTSITMRAFVESCRSRGSWQLVLVALFASGLAACSTDATRFNEGALANPYAARGAPANDSVAAAPAQS